MTPPGAPIGLESGASANAADVTWKHVPCALCGADRPLPLCTDVLHREGRDYLFHIVRCGACGFIYVTPRGAGALFHNLAGGSARRDAGEANAPIYARGLRALAAAGLPQGGRLLDLGCAQGDFLAFASKAGYQVLGVDLNPTLAAAARARGFEVLTGDLRDLTVAPVDAVTLWDVIEHVDNPLAVLRACRAAVGPSGLVFFHTGNARFQIPKARLLSRLHPAGGGRLVPHQHLSHFDPATARLALEHSGWQPLTVFFAGTLHYRRRWKRWAMGTANGLGRLPTLVGGPLVTNALAAIGRRDADPSRAHRP